MGVRTLTVLLSLVVMSGQNKRAYGNVVSPHIKILYQHQEKWEDHTKLLSAVQIDPPITGMHFINTRHSNSPVLLLMGDLGGAIHVLTSRGTVLSSQSSGAKNAVRAITSYRLTRNATIVLTGHQTGEFRVHLLHGLGADRSSQLHDDAQQQIELKLLNVLSPTQLLCAPQLGASTAAAECSTASNSFSSSGSNIKGSSYDSGTSCSPIIQLETAGGRGGKGLVSVVSAAGSVAVIRFEGKNEPGKMRVTRQLHSGVPIAVASAHGAMLTLLGPDGIAALPAGMADAAGTAQLSNPQLQWSPCAGLNGSALVAAVLQEHQRHSAYAVTEDGRLVLLVLHGNGGSIGCQVRSTAKLPTHLLMPSGTLDIFHPPHLSLLRGYLLLNTVRHLAVFNVSEGLSQKPPRLVLTQELEELSGAFMPATESASSLDTIASTRDWSAFSSSSIRAESTQGGILVSQEADVGLLQLPGQFEESSMAGARRTELMGSAGDGGFGSSGCSRGSSLCHQSSAPEAHECQLDAEDRTFRAAEEHTTATTAGNVSPARGPSDEPAPAAAHLWRLPLLVTNGDSLVAIGFGRGVVAVYESRLPQRAKARPPAGAGFMQVLQPVLFVGVAGIVLWRARNKRDGMRGSVGGRGGRDSLAQFEKLLRGSTARQRGPFGRLGPDPNEVDLSHTSHISSGSHPRLALAQRPQQQQQQQARRMHGGPPSARTSAASSGADNEGRVRLTRKERHFGMRDRSNHSGITSLRSYKGGGVSSPNEPSIGPRGDADLPQVLSRPLAEEDLNSEGELFRGDGQQFAVEGELEVEPQSEVDYAPIPPLLAVSGANLSAAAASCDGVGASAPAVAVVRQAGRQGLNFSDQIFNQEGQDEEGSSLFDSSGESELDIGVDWCGATMLTRRGPRVPTGKGAAELTELREHYADLSDD